MFIGHRISAIFQRHSSSTMSGLLDKGAHEHGC